MSTSQAREINNNKELTIHRLRNVSQRECRTVVYGVGTGPLISIFYDWNHYNNDDNDNNNNNNNNKIYIALFPLSPMVLYNKKNRKVSLSYLWWTNM